VETSRVRRGEAGRRVQEVQTQTPRSGFTDPRRKVRGEPNAGVRSQIPRPDFVVHVGPRNVQVSRDVDRPVTIKARVIEKIFSFREASASFQAEHFFLFGLSYRSAGDVACKRPVRAIILFFVRVLCPRPPRDFLFYYEFSFFLRNEAMPEGTVPPIVGGVEE
jgi:hypothetical protein